MYLHLMVAQILWYFSKMAFQYDSETVQQVSLVTLPQDEMTMKAQYPQPQEATILYQATGKSVTCRPSDLIRKKLILSTKQPNLYLFDLI